MLFSSPTPSSIDGAGRQLQVGWWVAEVVPVVLEEVPVGAWTVEVGKVTHSLPFFPLGPGLLLFWSETCYNTI